MSFYSRRGKRWLDLSLALPALVVAVPVGCLVSVAVRGALGTPVLFRQTRPGLNGEVFELIKFRTMTDTRDEHGALLDDASRLTGVGQLLRKTSLDELPTLWNVVRGDMGLVGPRPLLVKYMDRYSVEQLRRHSVRPGVTGWAQVNGRNATTWGNRLRDDVWYVDHLTFGLDLQILLKTIVQVLFQRGISAHGHATMPEFMGTDNDAAE